MAPSAVRSESPATYSYPLKQSRQGHTSVDVQTAANIDVSPRPSASKDGYANGSTGDYNGTSQSTRAQSGKDAITSESLLKHSQKIASVNGHASLKKPNILYIMADQMTASLLKMNNPNSVIKTPNLDKLAESGVVFSSAYCNSPLCAPSRFTMCTGQLPSKIGGYDNASILGPEVPTYAHYLRAEGYKTALAGKMHFIGPDQLHGFEERLTTDIYPADLGWSVDWDRPEERQEWFHNMSSVLQAGPTVRTNQLDYDEEVMHKSSQFLHEWVREPAETRRPFALTVSLTHPHDPYAMLRKYWDLYEDVDIPLPELEIPQDEQDPHSQRIMKCIDLWDNPVPDEAKLRARRAYFAECSFVDDQVGKLMQILKDSYLDDDTVIVFSGDHGDMLGERGLWYKMSWFENSARVPMVINYPSKFKAKRVSESVSTMDLLPTFVDIAGGDASAILPIDGDSLYDYLVSDKPGKDEVFGEYMGESTVTPTYMIRRHQWKYTCSLVDPPQLFDLVNDPQEVNNLALSDKPQHQEVLNKFQVEARAKWDFQQIHHDALKSQRYRKMCWKALQIGRREHWDYEPPATGRDKFIRSHIPLDDLELRARFPVVDALGREQGAGASHHGLAGARGE